MSGRERSKPVTDRFFREWSAIAEWIEAGGTLELRHLTSLLRNGERDSDGNVRVPAIVLRYLADQIERSAKKGRGQPPLAAFEKERRQHRAAYKFRDEIADLALEHGGNVAAALAAYATKNNDELASAKRRYRDALATIAKFERDALEILRQAAARSPSGAIRMPIGPFNESIVDWVAARRR
jgi:hypothetical protein